MKKKIKKYYVNPENSNLLAMSVVESPAVESNFVYFSKQKVDKFIALENNDKHMLYGCALRPDFPIYRNDGDEEYYLEFSKDAVERLSRDFMINGFQSNFTEAHKKEVDGISITESWLKVDMEKDKSIALGLDADLPLGSWFVGGYCNNAEVWQKVKNGEYKGFSVEAIVNVDEMAFEEQLPAETPTTTTTVVEEAPQPEEPSPSLIDQIKSIINDALHPQPKEEPVTEEPKAEEAPVIEQQPVVEEAPKVEEPNVDVDALNEVINNLKSELDALKEKNTLLENEKASLLDKVNELGKQPSAKPANVNNGAGNDTFRNWRDQMSKYLG